jgi:uncharacterized coiled-coil protein SlyX
MIEMEVMVMNNHDENQTTDQLPPPSHEARISALEANFAAQRSTLNEINSKLDLLISIQREMYVDLRGRLSSIERDVFQIKQDIQPDSFQNRLMRIDQ